MKRTTFVSGLIPALVLATASTSAEAQGPGPDFRLDHFKCYRMPEVIGEPVLPGPVILEDQFDAARGVTELVEVFVHLRFCNPVEKRFAGQVSEIKNPDHHLTLYAVEPVEGGPIKGFVLVVNQFGRQLLEVESANILAVPTAKTTLSVPPPLPPADLDHYKCYFTGGAAPKRLQVVGLKDQFETVRHKLGEPVLFCNPVRKTLVNGDVFEIGNREDHLTCYKISIATDRPNAAVVRNQFTNPVQNIFVASADILCVPSRKVVFRLDPNLGFTAPGG